MNARHAATVVLALAGCGRLGFDANDGGAPGDGGDGSDGGMPASRCTIPARPDISAPTTIVKLCTESAANAAVAGGGVVVFDCGTAATVTLTAPLVISSDVVIAGNGVTFDGQDSTTVMRVAFGGHLTLLDSTVRRGNSPTSGGGILVEFGASLVVFDSTFRDNNAAPASGSDGGGAIAALPDNATVELYRTTFTGNRAASGGAVQAFADVTVAASAFRANEATGTSGNGGHGGAIQLVGRGALSMCDVTIEQNTGLAGLAGGVHRISTDMLATDIWERVHFLGNTGEGAGAAYVQNVALTLRQVDVVDNAGATGGALWILGSGTFDAENVAVIRNRNVGGFGGGIRLQGQPGRIAFSTLTDNTAPCAVCSGGAISGGENLTLTGSVIAYNSAGLAPLTCMGTMTTGGANFQWPADPDPCSVVQTVADPMLLAETDLRGPGGTFRTPLPGPGAPVAGAVSGCPQIDLVGQQRPMPCSAGAVEP